MRWSGAAAGRLPPPRAGRLALLVLLGLAGCTAPPPSAYVGGGAGGGEPVGVNAVGETCTRQAAAQGGTEIYCGTWQQPSARLRPHGPATP
uniref:hypothetical protein n=1 Tax=Falsiroseomonas oryzae TaxID=2766473 RepID=UPI0022EB5ECF